MVTAPRGRKDPSPWRPQACPAISPSTPRGHEGQRALTPRTADPFGGLHPALEDRCRALGTIHGVPWAPAWPQSHKSPVTMSLPLWCLRGPLLLARDSSVPSPKPSTELLLPTFTLLPQQPWGAAAAAPLARMRNSSANLELRSTAAVSASTSTASPSWGQGNSHGAGAWGARTRIPKPPSQMMGGLKAGPSLAQRLEKRPQGASSGLQTAW